MKDPLDRLLASAAQTPEKPLPAEPPFGLETRVIAAWRETLALPAPESWWKLCGPFLATASFMVALSAAWNFHTVHNPPLQAGSAPTEFSMADSAIRLALNQ